MRRVRLQFSEGSGHRGYGIVVGAGALNEVAKWTSPLRISRAFLIVDSRLGRVGNKLARGLKSAGIDVTQCRIAATEAAKDLRRLFPVYGKLIESGCDRDSVLFAVGGGVIGDISGFIAATYLRGIRWVGIPTTWLAQVDSSVGGKTGVNHPLGKNLIGAFHQPELVICDTSVLKTLSPRDRISGLGETVKYGLTYDPRFFRALERDYSRLLRLEPAAIDPAVTKAVAWKAKIVQEDECERTGLRRTLNFGHTLGHALESATEYRRFRHGEAVIVGMRLALALSQVRGHLAAAERERADAFLAKLPVPKVPELTLETWLSYVRRDKKTKKGKVAYVLLRGLGKPVSDSDVTPADLAASFRLVNLPLRRS